MAELYRGADAPNANLLMHRLARPEPRKYVTGQFPQFELLRG